MENDSDPIGELLSKIDLVALASEDVTLKREGDYWSGPCPFEGVGRDRFSVSMKKQKWFCRGCEAPNGGTAIAYVMKKHGKNMREAVLFLQKYAGFEFDLNSVTFKSGVASRVREEIERVPSEEYKAAAGLVAEECAAALLAPEGHDALAYLYGRGLKKDTVVKFGLGYSDGNVRHGLIVPAGITIPKRKGEEVWYVKVRLLGGGNARYLSASFIDSEKAHELVGGVNVAYGDWQGKGDLFITEGEFDAMILWQETAGSVGALTMGGASEKLDLVAKMAVASARGRVFVAYDGDGPGNAGASKLLNEFPRLERAIVPGDVKDLSDYRNAGGDLGKWASSCMERPAKLHPLTQKCMDWLTYSGWVRVYREHVEGEVFLCLQKWVSCFAPVGERVHEVVLKPISVSRALQSVGACAVVEVEAEWI